MERALVAQRLAWLSALRILLLVATLVVVAFLYARSSPLLEPGTSSLLFGTLTWGFVLAAVFAALLKRGGSLSGLAHLQLFTDQLGWTLFAYATGGVGSAASSLYGLTCVAGGVVLGVPGVVTSAVSASVLFVGLGSLMASGILAPPGNASAYPLAPQEVLYHLSLNLLAVAVVALLTGYLSERLRAAGGALRQAEQRAAEAEQLAVLGRFAAGLAHEIRNPLGSIRGSVELLAAGPQLTEEDRALCGIISRESARLADLATDMLDLAKPRQPERLPTDVARLAADVVRLASASGRGVDVSVRYEGDDDGLVITADAAQVKQVLWNLVRNAVQASPPGAPVIVRARRQRGDVCVEVIDQGPGIPESARAKLFDAFFTTRSQGVGIGLAVVKRIVDDHGFSIEVENPPEGGAIFRVTAPAA